MADSQSNHNSAASADAGHYVVIARRYRPQTFDELVGQEHVAQALSNAVAGGRVGHAYLFTGARGVGKTSAARVFAKALNCITGPTPRPCNQCDICRAVSTGEDVDVLEIDGASNRGIEEIRQLRQNVHVRPSRARHKIYIIDEVHMLTREAFNALLKTLEEPPEHVKFIFCTTEPTKIPITILSRCQRFDFAGIRSESIVERLSSICRAEGFDADPQALRLLARQAAGSMRDSQSLLEQLLSFSSGRITADEVYAMLGIAEHGRISAILSALADRNAAAALNELDEAVRAGVDPGRLLEQLFGYLRDCLAAAVGCSGDRAAFAPAEDWNAIREIANRLGIDTITAAMQIIDHSLARMRLSTQGRMLAELALVQLCRLEHLTSIQEISQQIASGGAPSSPTEDVARAAKPTVVSQYSKGSVPPDRNAAREKKTTELTSRISQNSAQPLETSAEPRCTESGDAASSAKNSSQGVDYRSETSADFSEARTDQGTASSLGRMAVSEGKIGTLLESEVAGGCDGKVESLLASETDAKSLWDRIVAHSTPLIAAQAKLAHRAVFERPNKLVVFFTEDFAMAQLVCRKPESLASFAQAAAREIGGPIEIEIRSERLGTLSQPVVTTPAVSPQHRLYQLADHPFVAQAGRLFGAVPMKWQFVGSATELSPVRAPESESEIDA